MGDYRGFVDLPSAETKRLDVYIAENLGLMRRSQIKTRRLHAVVNSKAAKISRLVRAGDDLRLSWEAPPPLRLVPENIPLNIVYEDERVIVLNKPSGMVVHPGAGNWSGTLSHALLWRFNQRITDTTADFRNPFGGGSGDLRPFIVHRLDKDTSGLIIAAWDMDALVFLSSQFKARTTRKVYAAIVRGCPVKERGVISLNIVRDKHCRKRFTVSNSESAGKSAITYYHVIRSAGGCSLLSLRPKTGRTHQLRVHLRAIGHPIIGDPIYGHAARTPPALGSLRSPLALHAKTLEITLPDTNEKSRFKTKLPRRFKEIMQRLDS
jgi:23S rRNA pseudouridine1911/1915/1917 synthase